MCKYLKKISECKKKKKKIIEKLERKNDNDVDSDMT